jgi:hypothetical protein
MRALSAANWMKEQIVSGHWLYQDDAADEIRRLFGEACVYENAAGGTSISKEVLKEFNKITKHTVVWVRPERAWREREPHDPSGRTVG